MSADWELPPSWVWTECGEIADVVGGGTPSTSVAGYFGGQIPWVTPADMSTYSGKLIGGGARALTEAGMNASGAKWLPAGSVLFSSRAPIGYCAIASQAMTTNQGFKSFVLRAGVNSDFMLYWLRSAKAIAEELASGTTFLELSGAKAATLPIPLAPVSEQARIVEVLEPLLDLHDAGVAELQRAQLRAKQYRQSLLKAAVEGDLTAEWRVRNPPQETGAELLARILRERRARWAARQLERFGMQGKSPPPGWRERYSEPVGPAAADLPELPTSWAWATLDQLLSELRSGTAETSGRQPTGYPVLKSSAVRQGSIDFQALNYLEPAQSERQENYLERGDILITRLSGSVEYVGCCAVVSTLPVFRVQYPDRVFCGKPALGDASLAALVAMSFQAPLIRTMVETAAKSTAGHKRISLSDLYPLPIALPPPDELALIMDAVESARATVESAVRSVDAGLRLAAAQRQNILRAAFSGQLVPQDPTDEPASVLLARIRAERGAAAAQPAAGRGRKAKIAA